jgi:hypothetical protein
MKGQGRPRDLDPGGRTLLADSQVSQVPADRLAVDSLTDLVDRAVHLHLDLDVLHDSLGPVNSYGLPPGGIPLARLFELVEAIAHRSLLRSVALTAY